MIEGYYAKLFSTIVTSTIWQEDSDTKVVWITLLAIKNRFGEVAGSIPGLANLANVSIAACERALIKLESPDPYSRTKDNEGRRILTIDGGWRVLNHGKYQDAMNEAERKAYKAQWARLNRAKERGQRGQRGSNGDTAGTPTDTDSTSAHSRTRHEHGFCNEPACGACAKEASKDAPLPRKGIKPEF